MLVGLVLGRCNWVYLWFIKYCWVLLCLALFASINNFFSVSFLLVLDFGLLVLLTSPSVAVAFLVNTGQILHPTVCVRKANYGSCIWQ